jgi:hypothetical protein
MKKNIRTIIIVTAACLISYMAAYASVKSHVDFFWIMSAIGFVALLTYIVVKGFGGKYLPLAMPLKALLHHPQQSSAPKPNGDPEVSPLHSPVQERDLALPPGNAGVPLCRPSQLVVVPPRRNLYFSTAYLTGKLT